MDIEIRWMDGAAQKTLILSRPHGNAGVYYVSCNNYHLGQILIQNGQWEGYFNKPYFTREDVRMIGEQISAVCPC